MSPKKPSTNQNRLRSTLRLRKNILSITMRSWNVLPPPNQAKNQITYPTTKMTNSTTKKISTPDHPPPSSRGPPLQNARTAEVPPPMTRNEPLPCLQSLHE